MADYKLSYTGDQTDEALGKAMKAVLTEAQNLTPVQQEQVRQNIGAGTSDFSGSYNDLTDKPDVEKGPKGDPGVTPDLQIGTVTTGEEGTEASANITGTAEKPYLNLVLPRGATGPQGEPGSDASVTADNIQAALGYTPVKDVQVDGSSVLVDGVAKVPIAQADAPGVVSVLSPQDSGIWNDGGSLKVSYATDAEISSRTGTRKAIVCANMDYAVKAAMCDGKGAAWTDEERLAALLRLGCTVDNDGIVRWTAQTGG